MNVENTKQQMRKGILEFCILSVLKDRDLYASEILERLKEARLLVVEGTLYPFLHDLKTLICSSIVGKNQAVGHPENTTRSLKKEPNS